MTTARDGSAEAQRPHGPRTVLVQEDVVMPARADRLAALHAALERFWTAVDVTVPNAPPAEWRMYLATALGEIGANIVRHAHPEGSEPGIMRLRLRAFPHQVEARFQDRGVPFAKETLPVIEKGQPSLTEPAPDPEVAEEDALLLAEGGYGLKLVLSAVDRLDYARTPRGQNTWRLVKRF